MKEFIDVQDVQEFLIGSISFLAYVITSSVQDGIITY